MAALSACGTAVVLPRRRVRALGLLLVSVTIIALVTGVEATPLPFKGEVVGRVHVGGHPVRVFLSEGQSSFAVLDAQGHVVFVDRVTHEVLGRTETLNTGLLDGQLTPDGRHLVTWSSQGSELFVVSFETRALAHTLDIDQGVQSVAAMPGGETLAVSSSEHKRITWFDVQSWRRRGVLEMSFPPGRLFTASPMPVMVFGGGVDAPGTRKKAVGTNLFLLPLHSARPWEALPAPLRSLDVRAHPRGVPATADERWSGGRTRTLNANIRVHRRGAAFTVDGRLLLTTHPSTPVVSVAHLESANLHAAITVPEGPGPIRPLPSGHQVVVLHQRSAHASVIDAGPLTAPSLKRAWKLSGVPFDGQVIHPAGWMVLAMPGRAIKVSGWRYGPNPLAYSRRPLRVAVNYRVGRDARGDEVTDTIALFHPDHGEVATWKVAPGPAAVERAESFPTIAIPCAADGSVLLMR